ncbi:MAG: WecB/TagA/CpsF family glycosyltransferase [Deltaproteobacteria bacterium]|nr:WecB/TagA/CpsF family glycosyltransferase [Deltaproteobacteria bacterium]
MTHRVDVLGVRVDALTRSELLDRVEAFVVGGRTATVAYLNLHVLDLANRHPDLADCLQQADLCYCDGEGVRLAARILGAYLPERITGADWIWDLAARAEGRWRLAWIGGEPGVSEQAAARLRLRHPGLEISAFEGNPTEVETGRILASLDALRPQVVLVGMGTPLQERWVRDHRSRIRAPVVWCVGGTADVVSGRVQRGPALLYRHQEWAARLLADPRRLWRRTLVEAPRVLLRAVAARVATL